MREDIFRLSKDYHSGNGVHIFYNSFDVNAYIENASDYVISAIQQEKFVMIIENERLFPLLMRNIKKSLTPAQIETLYYINSFEFYCYRKNFYPSSIVEFFLQKIAPYLEKNMPVCTWGHVEWSDEKQISSVVAEYEHRIDRLVNEIGIMAVCAYDGSRVSPSLKKGLLNCHSVYMTDKQLLFL
ncbi:MEDS domain-containing protein [Bacillus sp. 1P06AnD]|uniref:MEDS domain-containing protein n=1 Tax=Bacillus sp. 1P06AnD TaxID=3132208 RepID=UPI00399F7B7A